MSGVDGLLAKANKRWSRAMDRARDVEDLGLGPVVTAYYTRYFPVLALACLGLGAGVWLLTGESASPEWLYVLLVGFAFAMLGSMVGGLVHNSKRLAPAVRLSSVDVLYILTDAERKLINRQIAGRASLDRGHLPVVRAGAIQLRKALATQLIFMPLYAFFIAVQAASFALRTTFCGYPAQCWHWEWLVWPYWSATSNGPGAFWPQRPDSSPFPHLVSRNNVTSCRPVVSHV